jgi:hypothetical protein
VTHDPAEPVLLTVRGSSGPPDLAAAARQLGLEADELDADFGVVVIDPDLKLYAVRSASPRAARLPGAHADPKIEPMGPPD